MAERITSLDQIEDAEKFLAAHYQAQEDLTALRSELKAAQNEANTLRESGSEEVINKWRGRAVKQAAKAALEGSGIKDADRVLKYINLDGVDFDEKDALVGLDEKLTEVKTDFPELFDVKRRAGSQSADIHADSPAKTDPLAAAVHAAMK